MRPSRASPPNEITPRFPDGLTVVDSVGQWRDPARGRLVRERGKLVDHGRVFAHVVDGQDQNKSYELPRLGKISFENAVANPHAQLKTIVMLNDDAGRETNVTVANVCRSAGQTGCTEAPSELYMYVGRKQRHGNQVEQAGLTNGNLYGVRVRLNGGVVTGENPEFVFGSAAPAVTTARFELVSLGDVSGKTGVQIQDESIANQVTQFIRVEDGAWDPRPGKSRDYYFVTTGRITTSAATWRPSRLWRLRFDDIERPEAGGKIEMLLTNQFYAGAGSTPDADPGYQMFDNLTIDRLGRIVLQEDVGGNDRLGRIYVYGIDSGELVQVAQHNPKFFRGPAAANPNFLTNDEESSGVIDASDILGRGWFLLTVQNHKASADPELVEGGQLLAMPRPISEIPAAVGARRGASEPASASNRSPRASGRSARAGTSALAAAARPARCRSPRCPRGGSATAAPASSSRRPTARTARSPRRHRPSRSAGAGNGSRPAATGCGGTARSRRGRLGGAAAARRGRSRGRLTVS